MAMAMPSLSRGFPASLLRQASGPRIGPVYQLSPAAGARLMGTRCLEKEAQEMIGPDGHLLLRQKLADLRGKTSRDLDELTKFAKILNKAANVFLGVTIIGVPWYIFGGKQDKA